MREEPDLPATPTSDTTSESIGDRRSRWAVAPGSIDDTYGNRPPHRHAWKDDDEAPTRARSASEILAAARRASEAARNRRGGRSLAGGDAALQEDSDPTATPRDVKTSRKPAADDTRSIAPVRGRRPVPDVPAPAAGAAVGTSSTQRSSTRLTKHRPPVPAVKPDLGESKELRRNDQIGQAPVALLAGFGGVILILLAAAVGTIIDVIFTSQIGIVTAITLSIGAFFAALLTRKSDLLSVIVAPPIVYAALSALVLVTSGSPLTITNMAGSAIDGFIPMCFATAIAAIIAGIKLITTRPGERR